MDFVKISGPLFKVQFTEIFQSCNWVGGVRQPAGSDGVPVYLTQKLAPVALVATCEEPTIPVKISNGNNTLEAFSCQRGI